MAPRYSYIGWGPEISPHEKEKLGTLFKDDRSVLRVFLQAHNLVQSILTFDGCNSVVTLSEKAGHREKNQEMSATAVQKNDLVFLRKGKETTKHVV